MKYFESANSKMLNQRKTIMKITISLLRYQADRYIAKY